MDIARGLLAFSGCMELKLLWEAWAGIVLKEQQKLMR
jgi:hypothetical protein